MHVIPRDEWFPTSHDLDNRHRATWRARHGSIGLIGLTASSATTVDRQFVWGLRYIDELILRDRSVPGGTLNERLFATQDANWNVTAITDSGGNAQERYQYDPYGNVNTFSPLFLPAKSEFDWDVLYAGYHRETNLCYYARHRYLLTHLSVWLTRDPYLSLSQLVNLYDYVRQQPLVRVDPLGLKPTPKECCEAAISTAPKQITVNVIDPQTKKPTIRTCTLAFSCNPRCPGDFPGLTYPRVQNHINICIKETASSPDLVVSHELVHAMQFCRGSRQDTCEECMKNEREAHASNCAAVAINPNHIEPCIECGVYLSCKHLCPNLAAPAGCTAKAFEEYHATP